MFAVPVIVALLGFVLIRPQEYYTAITVVPWLHLWFGLGFLAYMIDVRVGAVRPQQTPQLPWMIAFAIWVIVATGVRSPATVMGAIVPVVLFVAIGYLMGNTIQSLKGLNVLAVAVTIYATGLSAMAVYQSREPLQCLKADFGPDAEGSGTPDGRPCVTRRDCEVLEPGASYYCERMGVMGTNTICGRVRYRGIMRDPNDLSLVLAIALPLLIVLMRQRPTSFRKVLVVASSIHTFMAIIPTQSRGGQIVFIVVLACHFFFRYGLRTSVIAGIPVVPLGLAAMMLGKKRHDADESANERIRCQWNALRMLGENPLTGVGFGQITEHWGQTAHNAYLLAPAELGFPGMFLWYAQSYVAFKLLIKVRQATKDKPEARAAYLWSEALLASNVGMHVGICFLSFCYHFIYWIFIGLAGAVYKTAQAHDPEIKVRFTRKDWVLHSLISGGWLGIWKVFIEYKYARI